MMTSKRKKEKRFGITDHINLCTWNIRGISNKIEQLEKVLEEMKIDVALITETKKKLRGTVDLSKYTMIYSGVTQNARAGVAILMNMKWKDKIHSYEWLNERITTVRFKIDRGYLTLICVYAPDDGRLEESREFYKTLQKAYDMCNKNDYIIIGGDLNARIGNQKMRNNIGKYGEETVNRNGERLREFTCFNNLKIMNSFFKHKRIHTMTWAARGTSSVIDYFIANWKAGKLFNDTRSYRGADVGTDHFIVKSEVKLRARWWKERIKSDAKVKWKTYLLRDDSIKQLFEKRMNEIEEKINQSENIETEWSNIKLIVTSAATEALGTQKCKRNKKVAIWDEDIKKAVENKKRAYLDSLQNQEDEKREIYIKKKKRGYKTYIHKKKRKVGQVYK